MFVVVVICLLFVWGFLMVFVCWGGCVFFGGGIICLIKKYCVVVFLGRIICHFNQCDSVIPTVTLQSFMLAAGCILVHNLC